MKLKLSEIKTCRVAYLYNDGHLVLIHEKKDKDAGKVEWATIYENVGIKTYFNPGRLIISPSVLPFLVKASVITVHHASEKSGSDNTRRLGIQVETIELRNGFGEPWFITNFPHLISSDIYFNENDKEPFNPTARHWGNTNVKTIYTEKSI